MGVAARAVCNTTMSASSSLAVRGRRTRCALPPSPRDTATQQQFSPRDADQPVIADLNTPVMHSHRHVVPAPGGPNVLKRLLISCLEIALCTSSQPYPEGERLVRPTLLVDSDSTRRPSQLQQMRGLQPAP